MSAWPVIVSLHAIQCDDRPESVKRRGWSTHSTFASDGDLIMPERPLFNFTARSLYLLNLFVLAQMPPSLKVHGVRSYCTTV